MTQRTETDGKIFGARGPYNDSVRTLQEVADILGCSRANVKQVERRALLKLRQALRRELGDGPHI